MKVMWIRLVTNLARPVRFSNGKSFVSHVLPYILYLLNQFDQVYLCFTLDQRLKSMTLEEVLLFFMWRSLEFKMPFVNFNDK